MYWSPNPGPPVCQASTLPMAKLILNTWFLSGTRQGINAQMPHHDTQCSALQLSGLCTHDSYCSDQELFISVRCHVPGPALDRGAPTKGRCLVTGFTSQERSQRKWKVPHSLQGKLSARSPKIRASGLLSPLGSSHILVGPGAVCPGRTASMCHLQYSECSGG